MNITHLDKVITRLAHYSNAYWKDLGLHLGLFEPRLCEIEEDNNKVAQCMRQVLTDWLEQKHNVKEKGVPTWNTLAEAMRRTGHGSNPKAAEGKVTIIITL